MATTNFADLNLEQRRRVLLDQAQNIFDNWYVSSPSAQDWAVRVTQKWGGGLPGNVTGSLASDLADEIAADARAAGAFGESILEKGGSAIQNFEIKTLAIPIIILLLVLLILKKLPIP